MPLLDRTGPRGEGPKTGRGLGNCNNKKQSSKKPISRPKNINKKRKV